MKMSPPNSTPPGDGVNHDLSKGDHVGKESTSEEDHHRIENMTLCQDQDQCGDEDDQTEEDETEIVVPPDGGWGWVVVAASFMCNMIVDGIIFSFGMFLKDIALTFDVTTTQAALVGSLTSGFYLIVGPFASAIANRYGFRLVAIMGSFIAAAAFALSYFATSIQFLCLSYGLLGGIGLGFIYVPSVITVGFYFERWRALATGVAVCGSGIGTFLFAPVGAALINSVGWRSALLCQGGILFTCAFFGSLYRPLKAKKINEIKEAFDEEDKELVMDIDKLPTATKLKMEQALNNMNYNNSSKFVHHSQRSIPRLLGVNNNCQYPRLADVYHTISTPQPRIMQIFVQDKQLSLTNLNDSSLKTAEGVEPLLRRPSQKPIIISRRPRTFSENIQERQVNRPMYRDDIFFSASLTRLPQYTSRTSIAYNLAVTRIPTKNDLDEEKKRMCKVCPEAMRRTLATMLDYTLFKSPSFILLAIGGFLAMMGFYVPYMYLADRARASYGMDENTAVWLISSIGIANTIGRVGCGVISSLPGVNALFVTNVALTIGGIATIFSGFSPSVEYQFTYSIIFGFATSCFASLRSIIVVDLLGLEKLTNAFGLLLLFQGIAAAIGAPLAGAFMDVIGSYDASFYLSGSLFLASAVISYPLNWVNKWEMGRKSQLSLDGKAVPV